MNPTNNLQTSSGVENDAFLMELQNKLMNQAGSVSSANSEIDKAIKSAISGISNARGMENLRLESQFGRELSSARTGANLAFQDFSESRRGFATQMTAFRNLVETTDKQMNDLESRKQELILANNAQAAEKIAELQVQALDYREKAKQQVFDNMFNLGSFSLAKHAEARAGREFAAGYGLDKMRVDIQREELNDKIANEKAALAAEFGVTVEDGETLEDIVRKVAPLATQERRARLRLLEAQTAKEMQGIQKQTALLDLNMRIAALISNGMSPSEATLQALGEMQNVVGYSPSVEEINKATSVAEEIAAKLKETADKTAVEESTGWFRKLREGSIKNVVQSAADLFSRTILGEEPNQEIRRYNELMDKGAGMSPAEFNEWVKLDNKYGR